MDGLTLLGHHGRNPACSCLDPSLLIPQPHPMFFTIMVIFIVLLFSSPSPATANPSITPGHNLLSERLVGGV